jgi:hypothetical protein
LTSTLNTCIALENFWGFLYIFWVSPLHRDKYGLPRIELQNFSSSTTLLHLRTQTHWNGGTCVG